MKNVIKWYNTTEIVDVETGELLTKSQFERRNLRVIKKTVRNEFTTKSNAYGSNTTYGSRIWTWECREHEQTRLEI